ncbi:hypothetical protein [Verrucomicrobium sp. GAS474]|uniref:hypothetical protein n=1 Tax=Verrucomicrobium sp. GAS474 TaxID=1882831 RepID=UPI000B87B536|nr:hypothetical protein [Verrucomicrobium sp. GAS474]
MAFPLSPLLPLPALRFLAGIGGRAFLLIATYSLLIEVTRPTPYLHNAFDSVWHRIAEEQLASHRPEATGVIVGSSYSRMLGLDFPPDFLDGGFFGGGPMTGNAILLESGAHPRAVLIEINRIDRPLDRAIVDDATAEPMATLRRFLPALRFEYRPSRVIQSLLWTYGRAFGAMRHGKKSPAPAAAAREPLPSHALPPPAALDDALRTEILRNFAVLERQVAELERRGIRPVFLHLPLDPAAEAAPVEHFVHATAAERFPKSRYPWIDLPSDGTFRTYDGTHIPPGEESRRVAGLIVDRTRALLQETPPAR